jgi:hypothetical protein
MYALKTSAQRTPPTPEARRATGRADHGAGRPGRQRRETEAVIQAGRIERELLHPIGVKEGYTPAGVQAAQMREELARRFERPTRKPDRVHAVTYCLWVDG